TAAAPPPSSPSVVADGECARVDEPATQGLFVSPRREAVVPAPNALAAAAAKAAAADALDSWLSQVGAAVPEEDVSAALPLSPLFASPVRPARAGVRHTQEASQPAAAAAGGGVLGEGDVAAADVGQACVPGEDAAVPAADAGPPPEVQT